MRSALFSVVLFIVLAGAVRAADSPKLPEKVQPYVELSRQCTEYEALVNNRRWQEVWREDFDATKADKWKAPGDQPVR